MTTTYLNVANMSDEKSVEVVKKLLCDAGYKVITIRESEIKLGWNHLTSEDVRKIRRHLETQGFDLQSVCQTIWSNKSSGAGML